uniref:Lanthionine synthetase n=1 Tax=Thermosporothrix sp. COM3 TaxID=2490863 RepID=A0A455SQZ7_9CHLR|nr:hypothetical protein KTC_23250 [Thermosporothrix sp. COM3]
MMEEKRLDARQLAEALAARLRDPATVLETVEQAGSTVPLEWGSAWFTNSFANLAYFYLYLYHCLAEEHLLHHAMQYLRLAARATQDIPLTQPGFYGGSSGFAWIVGEFAEVEPRYTPLFQTMRSAVAEQVLATDWKRVQACVIARDYDVMSGAAGVLGYMVSLKELGAQEQDALSRLLDYLIWLGAPTECGAEHWLILPENYPSDKYRQDFPRGYFNAGLAHGIAGPLSALALAWQAGYRREGQREAMRHITEWLLRFSLHDTWGINWPVGVSIDYVPDKGAPLAPARAAWCYGAPGISAALRLAARALGDTRLAEIAVEGLETALKRPRDVQYVFSPTLCHGFAGLLTICMSFCRENHASLEPYLPGLIEEILQRAHPEHAFLLRDEEIPGHFVDDPGFLVGATGAVMALLATDTAVYPAWYRALLIA